MRVGSLFSGYGGLDMAVGGDLAWYAEVEPAACKVMAAHHPGVPNLGDVTRVDWSQVERVDVITAGYPCQPFSNAGNRKGKDDERHLWPYVRDAIGALGPSHVVLENVRGHLTLGFADVLADLADLGMSARWGVVRAADAGAPHNRARLFIVTDAAGDDSNERPAGHNAQHERAAGLLQVSVRGNGGNAANATSHEWAAAESDDLHAPRAAELGERASAAADAKLHGLDRRTKRRSAGASKAEGWMQQPQGRGAATWGEYAPAIDRWERVLGRPAPAPTVRRADRDRLSPLFVEWMMGLPEGWVTGHGLSASQELKMLGNGVVPQQAALALRLLGAA